MKLGKDAHRRLTIKQILFVAQYSNCKKNPYSCLDPYLEAIPFKHNMKEKKRNFVLGVEVNSFEYSSNFMYLWMLIDLSFYSILLSYANTGFNK